MFDEILVPIDGSDCASVAVGYAEDLATRYDATVHVLSVVDSRALEDAPHYDHVKAERTDLVEEACEELDGDLALESAVRTGVPHAAILDYADEAGVDLVVMGTHGRTGVERYVLGSVTEKVLRLSDVPVLTVRTEDGVTFPYGDVLVPTDGSAGAGAAIEPGVSVASTYGATLHALSVVDTRSLGVDVRSTAIVDALETQARESVETVDERARAASVPDTETAVEYGLPYEAIQSYVEDEDVDLVVMGTHGRSGIARYLLGSVAEKLVRTSPAPVMTVRGPSDDA